MLQSMHPIIMLYCGNTRILLFITITFIANTTKTSIQALSSTSFINQRVQATVAVRRRALSVLPKTKPRMNMINSSSNSKDSEENNTSNQTDDDLARKKKRLILIRHGKTYMNEYLAKEGSQWGDENFTDVGLADELYRDSPLSEFGIQQAKDLCDKIGNGEEEEYCIDDIDLVVVSPLTRTFQTLEYALLPHLRKLQQEPHDCDGECNSNNINQNETLLSSSSSFYKVPIISIPLASERVYLKSDLGLPLHELKTKFPYAIFENDFQDFEDEWWFTVKSLSSSQTLPDDSAEESKSKRKKFNFNSIPEADYEEWRPSSQNQSYSCYGEPDLQFNQRMTALCKWIESRDEMCICMISHWGVLDWLSDGMIDFDNCEWRELNFDGRKKVECVEE